MPPIPFQQLEKLLPGVQENVPLKGYTSFKIGGPARYFFDARDEAALVAALKVAEEYKLPVFVLGNGSNILVSDRGFDGLVIHNGNRSIKIDGETVTVGSGMLTMALLLECAKHGLGGMEFMTKIPATVGAAVYGNAGAWGHGFGELCREVRCLQNGKVENLSASEMQFTYRGSVLHTHPGTVLSATLSLQRREPAAIMAEVKEILSKRGRVPHEPSAGCVFRNIELGSTPVEVPRILSALDITKDEYEHTTRFGKLPIGFVLEKFGLRGTKIGGAQISPLHANIIVNAEGRATADDVMQLIALVKTRVRNQLGIQLHEEIQFVGY
ncbi:MAG: UDP-N-acetylmuramate dehydrogenase [Patescibacteria group bacterium]|nr:UDP-N-acetylmuramate dehydrogenase [Patescibacteria group bacterium]